MGCSRSAKIPIKWTCCGEQALIPLAIEEMLRYDGPVQSTVRYPKADVSVDGVVIKEKTPTFVIIAAANRDPEQFDDSDRFAIRREPQGHLAFGEGIHYCLGAPLARMQGAIAIAAVLERFPNLRLDEPDAPLKYKGSYFLRGLACLRMTFN